MIKPPKKRKSVTYELVIHSKETGRFKFYLAVGLGELGTPVEVWIDCAKTGTMLREFMHAWAATASIAIQSGAPLRRLVKFFKEWDFEPRGKVEGVAGIESCSSPIGLVGQVIEKGWPLEAME